MMRRIIAAMLLSSAIGSAQAVNLGEMLKQAVDADGGKTQPGEARPKHLLGKVSPEEETAIGRDVAGKLLGAAPLVDNPELQRYVNRVGNWVAAQAGRPELAWRFGVLASDDVNAFAAPGGYVFITRGLYRLIENEAQLAGVLAHEISHVTLRHHLKVLQKSELLDMGSQLLKGRMKQDERAKRVIGGGAEILARGLDKEAEFEADRLGVVLAARAGYDPFGLPAVLQEMAGLRPDSDAVSLLFKTHPHPDERLTRLDAAMDSRFDALHGRTLAERLYRLPH